MIENDFPVLRDTVRESAIGRSFVWLSAAISNAAADSFVAKQVLLIHANRDRDSAASVRMGAITVGVAAVAAWGLSRLVPSYVATAIPDAAYATVAALSLIAAARAAWFADQWRSSRLRHLMTR